MYKAMVFHQCPFGTNTSTIRAARIKPFKTLAAAINAIEKVGHGYIQRMGQKEPIWNNVQH